MILAVSSVVSEAAADASRDCASVSWQQSVLRSTWKFAVVLLLLAARGMKLPRRPVQLTHGASCVAAQRAQLAQSYALGAGARQRFGAPCVRIAVATLELLAPNA